MVVSKVYLWSNGNIMVFDEKGKQIPDLQRSDIFDLRSVKEASTKDTEFYFGKWKENLIKLEVSWLFNREISDPRAQRRS